MINLDHISRGLSAIAIFLRPDPLRFSMGTATECDGIGASSSTFCPLSCWSFFRHLLVDEQYEANVWQDVNEVGSETLVKPPRPLVPVSVPDALESAVVVTVLVLKTRPHNLVRIRRYSGDELGQGCEEYVFSGCLKKERTRRVVKQMVSD